MKSILVPTDFSECAVSATKAAITIAQKTGAEIHFLHLISVPEDWMYLMDYAEKMYPDTQSRVRKASIALNNLVSQADKAGVSAKRFICYDESHLEILHHLEKHGNDFIVMGSHGISGFKQFLIGSMSQKIARQAPVPVLVVKNPVQNFRLANVVFTSDFGEEALPQFQEVAAFCKAVEATLHLVYINSPMYFTDSETISRKLEQFSAQCPEQIGSVSTYNYQSLDGGLVRFCEHLNPDLIALIIHGRKPLFNNLIDYTLNYSGKPVLSINKEVVKAHEVV
ncbi:universal stress protein [Cesiribacter sp. SM1]|uniref:universal stress protein n=1 Tax=Cesiribacter sp. SM1 TaxID=2861196 RepID=UPI001CD1A231|nr:universal stress protein [Cesiribacter sp. SM1]